MLRNVFSNWTAMALTGAISVFLMPFMIHALGDFQYGLWILVTSLLDYYGLLDFGMRTTLHRFVGRLRGANDRAALNETFATAILMTAGVGLLLVFLTMALAVTLPGLFGFTGAPASEFRWLVILYGFTVAVFFPARGFGAYLCGLQRFDVYNAVVILATSIRAILIFTALTYGQGIVAVAAAGLLAAFLSLVLNFAAVRKLDREASVAWRHGSVARMWSLVAYSFYAFLNTAGDYLRLYTDSVVIASRLAIDLVTHFSVANILMSYLRQIMGGLAGPLLPKLSELDGEGHLDAFRALFLRATRITALLSIYLGALVVLNGDSILRLWVGERFVASYSLVLVLTWAYVAALGQYPATVALYARDRHQALGWWMLAEGAANLLLSLHWARPYGLLGVAWGTALPMLWTSLVILPVYVTRLTGITLLGYARAALVRPALVGFVFIGIVHLGAGNQLAPGFTSLAFAVLWQTLIFWTLAATFALNRTDRRTAVERLRHVLTRIRRAQLRLQATSGVER